MDRGEIAMDFEAFLKLCKGSYLTQYDPAIFEMVINPLYEAQQSFWPSFETFYRAIQHLPVEGMVELLYYSRKFGK